MVQQQLILFLGVSASFKSTIAAGFGQQGYPVVGDDMVLINPHGGILHITPSQLPLQLMEDACRELNFDLASLNKVRKQLFRYEVPFNHAPHTRLEQGIIYRLNSRNEPSTKIEEIEGIVKLNSIINNTYCYPFLKASSQEKQNLKTCSAITKHMRFRDLCIGQNVPTLDSVKQILEDIESCIK